MLRWAREQGCAWDEQHVISAAAGSGNTEMVAWILQQPNFICSLQAIRAAAARGDTAMCACLRAQQPPAPWHLSACCAAARGAHFETLRWLHEHGCPWDSDSIHFSAAQGGSVDVMAYVQAQGLLNTARKLKHMLGTAGAYNKLAAAQWLRGQGAEWPAVLRHCRKSWCGDVLAWARAEGCTARTN
jgi:hypothetical protein